jgi:hypothetical protein
MKKIGIIGAGLVVAGLSVPAYGAEALPAPKVFHGIPAQKGQWRVEILKMDGQGEKMQGAPMPQAMSICMDNLMDMGRNAGNRSGSRQEESQKCKSETLENTANRGVFQTNCEDGTSMRSTIVREGPKSFLIEASGSGRDAPFSMKSRYSYEGACKAKAGSGVMFDKSSEVCRQMQAQMGQMDPGTACAGASGAARQMCEEQIGKSLAQMKGMCGE